MRTLGRLSHAAALACVFALAPALLLSHPRFLFGTLVGDDAGYYLAIARNVVGGHGFSFDRLHPTNGFNPLMPMLLVPLDALLAPGRDLVVCFRIGVAVTWVAMAFALVRLDALMRRLLEAGGVPAELAIGARGALAHVSA